MQKQNKTETRLKFNLKTLIHQKSYISRDFRQNLKKKALSNSLQ